MGIGDEVMVTGEVKRRAAGTQKKFAIIDPRKGAGLHRWNEMWQGNPRIVEPGMPYDERLINCGGHRPYIAAQGLKCWKWKEYEPEPGELFMTPQELEFGRRAAGRVIIQPAIKPGASPNKSWTTDRWRLLAKSRKDIPWLQIGLGIEERVRGVEFLETRTFRLACGVLASASAAVLNEGGLHHAAAALGTPSVVIFGGYISPLVTGYKTQRNLFSDPGGAAPLGCGSRVYCKHCVIAMAQITPQEVSRELEATLCRTQSSM